MIDKSHHSFNLNGHSEKVVGIFLGVHQQNDPWASKTITGSWGCWTSYHKLPPLFCVRTRWHCQRSVATLVPSSRYLIGTDAGVLCTLRWDRAPAHGSNMWYQSMSNLGLTETQEDKDLNFYDMSDHFKIWFSKMIISHSTSYVMHSVLTEMNYTTSYGSLTKYWHSYYMHHTMHLFSHALAWSQTYKLWWKRWYRYIPWIMHTIALCNISFLPSCFEATLKNIVKCIQCNQYDLCYSHNKVQKNYRYVHIPWDILDTPIIVFTTHWTYQCSAAWGLVTSRTYACGTATSSWQIINGGKLFTS